jgi:hypothetical protein
MRTRVGALALAASIALLTPGAAAAANITAAQLQSLAGQAAAGDAGALAELRQTGEVDGNPAAVAAALQSADPAQLRSRLATLSAPRGPSGASASQALSPTQARAAASAIVGAGRYSKTPLPDPVGSTFDKLGRWLGKLAARAPGGPVVFWGVLGALVLGLAALGARRTMRRLDPQSAAGLGHGTASAVDDPTALEQAAQAAEARGAFADAVRLRFRAGLLRLSFRGALDYRPSLLTADARRRLGSPEFDTLASSFERIAYGGAPAAETDAVAAREGWRKLLAPAPGR